MSESFSRRQYTINIDYRTHTKPALRDKESCSFSRLKKKALSLYAMHTLFLRYSPPWTSQESRRFWPSKYGPTVEVFLVPFSSTIAIMWGGTENEQKRRYKRSYRRRIFMSVQEAFLVAQLAAARSDAMRGRGWSRARDAAEELHGTGTSHEKSDNTKLVLEDRAWDIVTALNWNLKSISSRSEVRRDVFLTSVCIGWCVHGATLLSSESVRKPGIVALSNIGRTDEHEACRGTEERT